MQLVLVTTLLIGSLQHFTGVMFAETSNTQLVTEVSSLSLIWS